MSAAVEVHNATKSFGANQVLNGLDFTAQRGKVTVIIGPSGSGKSTLLRVINHLSGVVVQVGQHEIMYIDERAPRVRNSNDSIDTAVVTGAENLKDD